MSTLKNLKSSKNKKDLWKLFDSIENEDEKIECLYSSEEINNFWSEENQNQLKLGRVLIKLM